MAIDSLEIKDANDVTRKVAADLSADLFYQLMKVAFGDDGAFQLVHEGAPLPVAPPKAATGTSGPLVAASLTVVTLIAANANRLGGAVYNASLANLFLKLGSGASAASYTIKLPPGGYYEIPVRPRFTGIVTGLWDGLDGGAMPSEWTA